MSASGGHTHGAADLRAFTPAGLVLLDNGTFGQLPATAFPSSIIVTDALADDAVTTDKILDDAVTTAKLDPSTIQYAEVTLTSVQVKALRATPQTLVAAPAAGYILEFVSGMVFFDYGGSNVFTESADNLALYYAGETVGISEVIEATGFLDQEADMVIEVRPTASAAKTKAASVAKAITVKNTGDGEIAGNADDDNVLRFKIAYRVHPTGF